MDEKDYEREFRELMEARDAGRTDGDGPADVAPVDEGEEADDGRNR